MTETMGQIIKKLRKERGLTQEDLAEQLGVTFQAISKWENDTGMPDISQIVPLATVFGVSTDVLFGMYGKNHAQEVQNLITHAHSLVISPATKESVLLCYRTLTDGLTKYPGNTVLLSACLESGISLAYPEHDTYDPENGKTIYRACIRFADLVIKYSENANDVMRAHMIMVLLHAAYGNMDAAQKHADQFPRRADMTAHTMYAYMAHFEKNTVKENSCYQTDLLQHLHAVLDNMVAIGFCYFRLGKYGDTRIAFTKALALIDLLFSDEQVLPSLHCRERGDIYALLAQLSLKEGDRENALRELERMVDFDLCERAKYRGQAVGTPLFRDAACNFYRPDASARARLSAKLHSSAFSALADEPRFQALITRTEQNQ
ncbi:MAG: helix-turn-helix transcriptional regulator [Clostridia bacterium]|nr:helix-turn-helix transcriptional regulator [Clostridia bacterium]